MADIQIENGNFTRISNELLEQLAKTNLNGTQFKIVMVIFRYTYGFNRKGHDLSVAFISNATNTTTRQIKRELNKLIEKRVITVYKEATFSTSRVIGLNKNYDEWINEDSNQENDKTPGERLDTTPGEQKDTTPGERLDTQERKDKENIKETIYSIFDTYSVNEDLRQALRDYSIMRNKIKAPLTNRAATLLLSKLTSLASTDDLKIKLLEQATLSNWKSVFPLKENSKEPIKQAQPIKKYNKFNDNMIKHDEVDYSTLEDKVRSVPDASEIDRKIRERFGS